MRYTIRPISDRSAFTGEPKASQFTVTYAFVESLLDKELYYLDAEDIVVEVDVPETGIRLDGTLRADAKASSPGVRLAFESNVGPLMYATDAFKRGATWAYVGNGDSRYRRDTMRSDWQHNLYAIALGLEALRKVDRYGITKRGEQYAGWKQLPAGTGAMPMGMKPRMTAEQARSTIAGVVGAFDRSEDDRERFRRARAMAHPDRNEGDRTLWDQVEDAGKVLGLVG